MITFNWKMKAKSNEILLEMFAPLPSLMCPSCLLFQSLFFQKPVLISNQACSIHCNVPGALVAIVKFLGHKHTISDEKLIPFLLFSLFGSSNFPVRSLKKYAQLLLLRGDKV